MRPSLVTLMAVAIPLAAAVPSLDRQIEARAASCGVRGYDKSNPQAYSYTTRSADTSQSGCEAKCAKSSKCASYAIGGGACLLYTSSV